MNIESFRKKLEQSGQPVNFFEGHNIGLIQLRSKSEIEPCLIIAEGKRQYFILHKDGRYDERPKDQFQIVHIQKNKF